MRHFGFFLFLLITPGLYAQTLQNGDFSETCEDPVDLPCHWKRSWGSANCCTQQESDGNHYLSLQGAKSASVQFVEQRVAIEPVEEVRVISLKGLIRTREVEGKGASLHLQLFDREGNYLTKKNMSSSHSAPWIQGTTEWTFYQIQMACPVGVAEIHAGVIFQGSGTADFDNIELEVYPVRPNEPSVFAADYMREVASIIAHNSLYKDAFNIDSIARKASWIVAMAETPEECQIGVEYMIESLRTFGDHHSFFMPANEVASWAGEEGEVPPFDYAVIEKRGPVGYVQVPGFHSSHPESILAFADSLQRGLLTVYNEGISGWIVDLRENDGGNMDPMIAGLGPLLDEGQLGSLIDVHGKSESWLYRNGRYFWDDEEGISVTQPVQLPHKLPIAVLTSAATGSSGEIVTISFRGNTRTRSFGQATWGLTTGNGEFPLKDGSILFLASTRMADRNGNVFNASVEPDVVIERSENAPSDPVVDAALTWLEETMRK